MTSVVQQALERGTDGPLTEIYDAALLDLDGVVYIGPAAVPHSPETLATARAAGMRLAFVTNNAARTPEQVAALIAGGIAAYGLFLTLLGVIRWNEAISALR